MTAERVHTFDMARSAIVPAPARSISAPRWAILLAVAAVAVVALGALSDRFHGVTPAVQLDPAAIRPGYGPRTFGDSLSQAQTKLAAARAGLKDHPDEWLRIEGVARALIARWRLTNDYADLAEADRLLDEGIAKAPYPSGPVLSRAMLSVTVHRLGQAESALGRLAKFAAPDPADLADAAALRGDIAIQRGDLAGAGRAIAEAERIARTPGSSLRGAMLEAYRGDRGAAAARLEALLGRPRQPPAVLADLLLQRASLAYWSGDWADAGRWVGAAQRVYPGYWLADAYAAQQFALAGRTRDAIAAYRIVARRSGRPEAMDALAHLLRLQGAADESRAWAARAAVGWEARSRLFPEAVAHHRAEHELAVGSAARALAIAREDAAQRPQAPNQVLFARALLSAGQPRAALAALDRADAQGWVSAAQDMARAEVEAALGHGDRSAAARARAEAINPRIADPRTRLIWFGHD